MTMALKKNEKKDARTSREEDSSSRKKIASFIPRYLANYVFPYHSDFCFSKIFDFRLIAALMVEGFLPIATDGVLLPKLHEERCVISLPDALHIRRSVRKKAKKFRLSVNQNFDAVVAGCREQHGDRCWLYPPLVEAFRTIHSGSIEVRVPNSNGVQQLAPIISPVSLYSIEIWNADGDLVGGELGYTVGSIYTSLTGFSKESSAGSVQLALTGRLLIYSGFTLWDLGMEMEYKRDLGSSLMPRETFVKYVHRVRDCKGGFALPTTSHLFDAKAMLDGNCMVE
jgi:Leu/Phe-tRNA-protein transferase